MTIQEIKAAISAKEGFPLGTLNMVRQFNTEPNPASPNEPTKTPTEFVSHWDNDHRVRITMHQDIMEQIKSNLAKADLAVKRTEIPAEGNRATYVRYVVITPRDVDATF